MIQMPRAFVRCQPRLFRIGSFILAAVLCFLAAPFTPADGFRMYANTDRVSESAPLTVSLHDINGQPIPGYTAKLTQAGLKPPLVWASGSSLPIGRQIRVKVTWPSEANPHLYPLYVDR